MVKAKLLRAIYLFFSPKTLLQEKQKTHYRNAKHRVLEVIAYFYGLKKACKNFRKPLKP